MQQDLVQGKLYHVISKTQHDDGWSQWSPIIAIIAAVATAWRCRLQHYLKAYMFFSMMPVIRNALLTCNMGMGFGCLRGYEWSS